MTVPPRVMTALRWAFLVGAVAFAWWGLRGQWADVVAAIGRVSPLAGVGAGVLVVGGLVATGVVWRRLLAGYGYQVPAREASAVFFIGQLGKYIPGSVWSLGAQAQMARRYSVPARTTIAVGLVFLWANVVTAASVGLAAAAFTERPNTLRWLAGIGALSVLAAMTPPVLGGLGRRLAGVPLVLVLRSCTALTLLLLAVWACYGVGTWLLAAGAWGGGAAAVSTSTALLVATGAFAVSYVVGVVLVIAPAGLGAREATLTLLLAPAIGLPAATATALLTRVVHTVADFAIAAVAALSARRRTTAPSRSRAATSPQSPEASSAASERCPGG